MMVDIQSKENNIDQNNLIIKQLDCFTRSRKNQLDFKENNEILEEMNRSLNQFDIDQI